MSARICRRYVRASAELLADRVAHYAFISTASVYVVPGSPADRRDTASSTRSRRTRRMPWSMELYGALKVACEQAVERAFPDRALILRPGIVAGPYDPTNRFTWWVERVARGGEVLAPGTPDSPVQLVDGRDLARVPARADGTAGNRGLQRVRPAVVVRRADRAPAAAAPAATLRVTWVSESCCSQQGVEPFTELPLWLPDEPGDSAPSTPCRTPGRAPQGLELRHLAETARDTWEWLSAVRAGDVPPPVTGGFVARGLAPEREAELIRSSQSE